MTPDSLFKSEGDFDFGVVLKSRELSHLRIEFGDCDCLGAEFESARRDPDLALVWWIADRSRNVYCGQQQNYQRQSDSYEAVSPCFHLCEAPREDWRAPERLESAAEPSINCRSIVFQHSFT